MILFLATIAAVAGACLYVRLGVDRDHLMPLRTRCIGS